MATIKNIGTACASRSIARKLAADNSGRIVDMAKLNPLFAETQVMCNKLDIANTATRWIVLAEKTVNVIGRNGLVTAIREAQSVSRGKKIECNGHQVNITSKRGYIAQLATEKALAA